MTDYQVKRNYKGQVYVMPPGAEPLSGEWCDARDGKRYFRPAQRSAKAYRRTSSAGEHLKGGGDGLANYKAAMAAIGVVMNESAQSEIATLLNEYDGDPYYNGDEKNAWKSGKKRLLETVDAAANAAGANSRSALGTEMHKLGEMINRGKVPTVVRPKLVEPLEKYRFAVRNIRFLHQEILIVNDELERAGSIDYLMELPAGLTTPDGVYHDEPLVCAGDLKTGRWDYDYPAGVYAQLAGYAKGQRYNQETNERLPLHERMNTKWGVLVHFPIVVPDAEVSFYWLDLDIGMRAAKLNNELDAMIKWFQSKKGSPVKFDLEAL
ncbi:exonuclease [Mycobacterium phage Kumao]|uniref:Exonuclease n=1 Tax=Mycobacterium phage Kumao TaxID=2041344 RepID=A0A2D1GQ00_9CAUD|nr:exonuclease [Mycobacterium phage Kumao]ATN94011.1 hypothetical protein SEA_KUMAO_48 [Mycobacterium phage Kumao]